MSTENTAAATGIAVARSALEQLSGASAPSLEQIRQIVDSIVPFCNFVGVQVTELRPDGATAVLPEAEHIRNHMGTVHAGALFLVAEVACAGAFSAAMAPKLSDVSSFVLRDARVRFLKPARGRIRAEGRIDTGPAAAALADGNVKRFETTGAATVLNDDDVAVVQVDFDYVCWMA